jgi:hypothetical protein
MQKPCQFAGHKVKLAAVVAAAGIFVLMTAGADGQIMVTPNDLKSGNVVLPSNFSRRHLDWAGKPCLSLNGSAKAQTLNPHIFEHWVSAANSCGQQIKVSVCYKGTDDCIAMSVPPWGRQDSVLGIFPASGDFLFDFKEQF